MKKQAQIALGLPLAWILALWATQAGPDHPARSRIERRVLAMGTMLTVLVDAPDRPAALEASEQAIAAVAAAESRLSTWIPTSELNRLNRTPAGRPTPVSPRLARDLTAALDCSRDTGGAFTPGLGRLVEAWGLRRGGRMPADEEIAAAQFDPTADGLRLAGGRATRLDERFLLEEGAFGKGAGLDEAVERLRDTQASGAVLDLGGQVTVWGEASATLLLADPRDRGRVVLRLQAPAGSVATSGDSERGIVVDGRRLGHILDPRSGRPAPDFGSVTVVSDSSTKADCLATGLYVLGPRGAVRWAAGRDDVAIVVLEVVGDGLVARASPQLGGRIQPAVADVELRWIER